MSKFRVGDKVRKIAGYPFVGAVCATYTNEGKCCVKHRDGWEHIFSDKQLAYDHQEYQYLDLLQDVLSNGVYREGRNGGTYGVFGRQIRFDLADGFPLLTTKKVHFRGIAHELIWFLSGSTNVKYLQDESVTIWDEWADKKGNLGPVYGKQWRRWDTDIDQISILINNLKTDPNSRRHVVTAWQPSELDEMALPPCHCMFQFFVADGKLSCQLYQRSADIFLGVPYNIASYALLTHMIANEVGLEVGEFVHTFGDLHLYHNHVEQAKEQLTRVPVTFPTVLLSNKPVLDMKFSDIHLVNYASHPAIKAAVSV